MKCCLWIREAMKELFNWQFDIDMPIRTVGLYLQRWGFALQRPAKQAIEQKYNAG